MQLHQAVFLAATFACGQVVATSSATNTTRLNGWYPCSEFTFSDQGSSSGQDFQCATYNAPLCYPGICEASESVDPTVEIFVKRTLATTGDPKTASNVWFLAGGPGQASSSLESSMQDMHTRLGGTVNVYTMDHRGTGRSSRLDCVAAQATTTGSPFGNTIDLPEVGSCAKDLHFKYGDLSSFSMTTAATDVATFISTYTNGASTIVVGISYGTALVERILALAPAQVTGYVFDSVGASSGSGKFPFISLWDTDFGEVGNSFMELCVEDQECAAHFKSKSLLDSLQSVLSDFDKNPNSTCAAQVTDANKEQSSDPPSFTLRRTLANLLKDPTLRRFIPPVVYRAQRCDPDDVSVLNNLFAALNDNAKVVYQDSAFESTLLYNLIVYSEMWETPSPSMPELKKRFTDMLISEGTHVMVPQYCAFSKEQSKTCNELNASNYDGEGIVYKRDEYWNKSVTIPNQASVLILNGGLDSQTPPKYTEYLLEALGGANKELVIFDYATHATLLSTDVKVNSTSDVCGMMILESYVSSTGDLSRLDKSCVDMMPAFNLTAEHDYVISYLGTDDAYDGAYIVNASSQYSRDMSNNSSTSGN